MIIFTIKLVIYLRKQPVKILHLERSFVWCRKLDSSESGSEIPGEFGNMLLEKDGEDHSDRQCEK